MNRWAALGEKMRKLIGVAERTEINALVIDVKDNRGFVLYRSSVPLARAIGADTNHAMPAARVRALLDTLYANGIYPIARMGFSEVQFDYVRFPDEKRLIRETAYPLANGRTRAQVIREQLGFLRSTLKSAGFPITADVFGLTVTDTTDMGIGQRWEMFVDQVDVVLPMVYPSHFAKGTYKIANPNAHLYETLDHAFKDIVRRSAKIPGAASVVPWYQDFTLGQPRYHAAQVRAQIMAGYDNGFQSWILWNPRSVYTIEALEPAKN